VQCSENEGLHGCTILQAEVAGTGRGQHAGHPVKVLTPPVGDALERLGIQEAGRIGLETSLLLAGVQILWAGDVLAVTPEAAKNGRAQSSGLRGLIDLHRRLEQQGMVGVDPHRRQLHGDLRRSTPHVLNLLQEGVAVLGEIHARELGGEMGFVFHADPIHPISDTQQIQPFIEGEAIGAIEIRNHNHPAAPQFRQQLGS